MSTTLKKKKMRVVRTMSMEIQSGARGIGVLGEPVVMAVVAGRRVDTRRQSSGRSPAKHTPPLLKKLSPSLMIQKKMNRLHTIKIFSHIQLAHMIDMHLHQVFGAKKNSVKASEVVKQLLVESVNNVGSKGAEEPKPSNRKDRRSSQEAGSSSQEAKSSNVDASSVIGRCSATMR